nr:MAG TPA: hypothetical protein [Podoviridae sp. ctY3D12]
MCIIKRYSFLTLHFHITGLSRLFRSCIKKRVIIV